jgi:hypothetical protein
MTSRGTETVEHGKKTYVQYAPGKRQEECRKQRSNACNEGGKRGMATRKVK